MGLTIKKIVANVSETYSMIKPWIRSLLFWSFFIFFIISAPLSVLYTAGYRYNFQNGQIVRTGVISIHSSPRNANIYLNDQETKKETPYTFKRLKPGLYKISIWREGFHEWHGNVEVRSGKTTLVQPIQLLKDTLPKLLIKNKLFAATDNGDSYVAYLIRQGGWSEVWVYNVEEEQPSIISIQLADTITDSAELQWSSDKSTFFVFDPTSKFLSVFDANGSEYKIDSTLYQNAQSVFWHPSNDNILYLSSKNRLYQTNILDGSFKIFTADDAASVVLDASILSFQDNGTNTEFIQTVNNDSTLIALLPRAKYSIAMRDGPYLILQDEKSHLFLLNIHQERPILLETNAGMFDWLENEDLLLFSNGFEVNIYDPNVHQTTFITRQGETIKNVLWHPEGLNIFIVTDSDIYALERFRIAKQRLSTPLLENANIISFWTSDKGSTGYFYGSYREDTGIFSLELTR